MENIKLSQANQAYLSQNKQNVSIPQETKKIEPPKDGKKKLKLALMGLAAAGAAVAIGVGIYRGKVAPKKAADKITDIPQDGMSKLLKENDKLTGKFSKSYEDGSNLLLEYSDGILQKSTKTASDGTQISEKIYSKAENGDKLVKITKSGEIKSINLTKAKENIKKHQENFSSLIKKQDASLEELQNFDKKNLSKKQIEELDGKIKAKNEAIELEKAKLEAKARLEDEAKAQKMAENSQEAYKQVFETKLSNKSAEESAEVMEAARRLENENILKEELRNFYASVSDNEKDINEAIDYQLQSELGQYLIKNGFDESIAAGHAGAYSYNYRLRKGEETPASDMLQVAFRKLKPTTEDLTVYRGIAPWVNDNSYVEYLKSLNPGDSFVDKGFSYASFKKEIANHFSSNGVCMEIRIPKGAKVSQAKNSEQSECLFNMNSRFRILSKEQDGPITKIIAEYILPD